MFLISRKKKTGNGKGIYAFMETMRNQTTCRFNPQKGYAIENDSTENFATQQTSCMRRGKQNII